MSGSSGGPGSGDINGGDDDELGDLHTGEFQDRNGQHHPIAEFLYQLTKMLTDDNTEIIEWTDGRIKVYYPDRLEGEVLHKYFRHSKFASFQRQLNYFGFRKIAGKGKMSPCSYVNEGATSDIRSLLLIKRKTNGSAARKAALHQQSTMTVNGLNPGFAGMPFASLGNVLGGQTPQALGLLNGQAISSAMSLLTENALRAGVGQFAQLQQPQQVNALNQMSSLLALQQQQSVQQQLQKHFQQQQQASMFAQNLPVDQFLQQQHLLLHLQQQQEQQNQESSLAQSHQTSQFAQPLKQASLNQGPHEEPQRFKQDNNSVSSATHNQQQRNAAPSLEQLHAQLAASLSGQAANFNASSLTASGMNMASSMNASEALEGLNRTTSAGINDAATAALNAQHNPATAAMNAASAHASINLFESAANLKNLLQEHASNESRQMQASAVAINSHPLRHRLPSSNTIFPEMSTASFGNLLGSSNRLSSLLSLNSFLGSREASLADFAAAMPPSMSAQLAAAGIASQQHTQPQQPDQAYRSNH